MPKKGVPNNPMGKGGFKDNPQNRSSGSWSKESSISYWYRYFLSLTVEEFESFFKNNPEKKTLRACKVAYEWSKQLETDMPTLKEITDRTEGRPNQQVDLNNNIIENVNLEKYKTKDLEDALSDESTD